MFWRNFLSKFLKLTLAVVIFSTCVFTLYIFNEVLSSGTIFLIMLIEVLVILMLFSNIGLRLEEVEHLENIEKQLKRINKSLGNDTDEVTIGNVINEISSAVFDDIKEAISQKNGNGSSVSSAATEWTCPDCDKINRSYADFCAGCGRKRP